MPGGVFKLEGTGQFHVVKTSPPAVREVTPAKWKPSRFGSTQEMAASSRAAGCAKRRRNGRPRSATCSKPADSIASEKWVSSGKMWRFGWGVVGRARMQTT
jgi:hypothetical protein